jgi:hypothetical protein
MSQIQLQKTPLSGVLRSQLDKPLSGLKVAFVTPTFGRDHFLGQSLRYFKAQHNPFAALRWFILDDSPARSRHCFFSGTPDIEYHWRDTRVRLGEKRNILNRLAQTWGADIICSMDDDDWYGPSYAHDMAELLLQNDACFAGSGSDYYYDAHNHRILYVAPVRENTSCNGVLCYKTFVLGARSYNSDAAFGEEPAFLQRDPVLQHPAIERVHLALAFSHNTVTKRNYVLDPRCRTALTLADFPMQEADRQFYRGLK